MRPSNADEEQNVKEQGKIEAVNGQLVIDAAFQDEPGRHQSHNPSKLQGSHGCQAQRMGKECDEVFCPSLPHGSKASVHPGAHPSGAEAEPYFLI